MGYVGMGRVTNTEFRLRILKERHLLADPDLDGDIILKRIWKKENGRTWQDRDTLRTLAKTVTKFLLS
jgi:hypothetical protein